MASKAPSPHNAALVQRPIPVAHDYHPNDPVSACRNNLAVRLYTQVKAGEDWQRWAETTGDKSLIAAVNEAVTALKRAHQIAAPKEYVERRKPKEGE